MGQVRGAAVQAVRNYVVAVYGEEGLRKVLSQLPEGMDDVFLRSLAISWAPASSIEQFYVTASRVLGVSLEDFARAAGRFNADRDIPSYFKFIVSKASPMMLFSAVPPLWRSYYDTGKMTVQTGDKQATATLVEFADAGPLCWDTCGFTERLLELTGVQNLKVTHPHCIGRGDSECVFMATWE